MEKSIFRIRQRGDGGVMFYGCFSARGKPDLVFVSDGIDGPKYPSILADTLLPFTDATYKGMSRFQQDKPHRTPQNIPRSSLRKRLLLL